MYWTVEMWTNVEVTNIEVTNVLDSWGYKCEQLLYVIGTSYYRSQQKEFKLQNDMNNST